ncbi:MAG: hypothetical protein GX557_10255, partial [Chloroflexi bacterium]|nr:hypothetical protein [Chloroflexota bacterium]
MDQPRPVLGLHDRIHGCLLGAAIGAELAYARVAHPERYQFANPADVLAFVPQRATRQEGLEKRRTAGSLVPFVALGVDSYLKAGGRARPEDLADCLRHNKDIAAGYFTWDGVHTTQEVLQEGMHPRIAGMLNAPSGMLCAAMPAVGSYHFADPEYAYLDGVELASVSAPREAADWAGLCAAAIAAAYDPAATPESITETVFAIARRHCIDLYYLANHLLWNARDAEADDATFAAWWMTCGGRGDGRQDSAWIGHHPIMYVLPLLRRYGNDATCAAAVRFMAL